MICRVPAVWYVGLSSNPAEGTIAQLRLYPRTTSMWKKTILGNWQIKVGAFIVAGSLWLHVVTERAYEDTVKVPLHVQTPPEGWILANPIPEEARITIRGIGKTFLRSGRRDRRIVLSPTYKGQIADTYTLSPSDVELPQDIQLVEIVEPKALKLEFDRPLDRTLSVKNRIVVRPASGYALIGEIVTDPEQVAVSGPSRYVRKLTAVYTDSLVRSKLRSPFSENVPLLRPAGANISVTPETITVSVDVQEIGERWIREIEVGVVNVPRSKLVHVEPSRIALKVKGGVEVVKSLKPEDCTVTIDYRQIFRKGTEALIPEVSVPPKVDVLETKPRSFSVVTR